MHTLNTYRFYELGAKLHSLFSTSAQARIADMFVPLTEAQTMLDSLIKGDTLTLETSKSDATRLLNRIGTLFNRYFIDPATKQLKPVTGEDRVDAHEMSLIHTLVEKFEHALSAELSRMPTYAASKLGIYSIYELAEHAENIFGASLRAYIPATAQREFNTAGRSLAFGLGTAASMHLLRATEMTIRAYYDACGGASLSKNERNFSIYLKKLSAMAEEEGTGRPDKRVVQMLSQIKDHYRSPLMEVDRTISVDEAMQLFGMASAIISLMAEQIKAQSPAEEPKTGLPPTFASLSGDNEVYDFPLSQAG